MYNLLLLTCELNTIWSAYFVLYRHCHIQWLAFAICGQWENKIVNLILPIKWKWNANVVYTYLSSLVWQLSAAVSLLRISSTFPYGKPRPSEVLTDTIPTEPGLIQPWVIKKHLRWVLFNQSINQIITQQIYLTKQATHNKSWFPGGLLRVSRIVNTKGKELNEMCQKITTRAL